MGRSKKGAIAWEYIAAMILGLIVLVVIIIFSTTLRDKMIEGVRNFMETFFGR